MLPSLMSQSNVAVQLRLLAPLRKLLFSALINTRVKSSTVYPLRNLALIIFFRLSFMIVQHGKEVQTWL